MRPTALAVSLTWKFTLVLPLNPYDSKEINYGFPLASYTSKSKYLPVTAKLLEIDRDGYTAPYESEAIVPRMRSVIFVTSIIIIYYILDKRFPFNL